MKKIIITNIILFLTVIGTKIRYFIEARKVSQLTPVEVSVDFNHLYVQISNDGFICYTDFSIYVLLIGLLINLFFLFRTNKREL
ncbi:MAG: hypothetical protein N2486_07825 [Caloramator sp.]|nr:hypothetical protein [Caloramator sp.]